MRYRTFRDWRLSAIGMGSYGLSGAYGRVDRQSYRRTIERARELGVNFFDTAQGYGEAEAFLGRAIRPFRKEIYLATKVSGNRGLRMDLSEAAVRQACHASLKNLGVDCIDLYQVHFDDPRTPVEETVAALERLAAEGKIRHYGLCHLPAARIREYLACGQVFSILMELSAAARAARQTLLPLCREHHLAALAFSVTGRGGLSGKIRSPARFEPGDIRRMDPLFQRERFASLQRLAARLAETGRAYGASSVQVAIAWVLAQEGVVCALTGPSDPAHLEENARAADLDLQPADLAALEAFLDAEEAALAERQRETLRAILAQPLPASPEAAFNDLVYALETAVLLGSIEEPEVLPLFAELLALRNEPDGLDPLKLKEIQARARARTG